MYFIYIYIYLHIPDIFLLTPYIIPVYPLYIPLIFPIYSPNIAYVNDSYRLLAYIRCILLICAIYIYIYIYVYIPQRLFCTFALCPAYRRRRSTQMEKGGWRTERRFCCQKKHDHLVQCNRRTPQHLPLIYTYTNTGKSSRRGILRQLIHTTSFASSIKSYSSEGIILCHPRGVVAEKKSKLCEISRSTFLQKAPCNQAYRARGVPKCMTNVGREHSVV